MMIDGIRMSIRTVVAGGAAVGAMTTIVGIARFVCRQGIIHRVVRVGCGMRGVRPVASRGP
jgi:hypothetical protein